MFSSYKKSFWKKINVDIYKKVLKKIKKFWNVINFLLNVIKLFTNVYKDQSSFEKKVFENLEDNFGKVRDLEGTFFQKYLFYTVIYFLV